MVERIIIKYCELGHTIYIQEVDATHSAIEGAIIKNREAYSPLDLVKKISKVKRPTP